MRAYWLAIDIQLAKPPKEVEGDGPASTRVSGRRVRGALVEFGVTAKSIEQALRLVEDVLAVDPGVCGLPYRLVVERNALLEQDALEEEIFGDPTVAPRVTQDPREAGIWYRSGKSWYRD